jgi:hypothetical protein
LQVYKKTIFFLSTFCLQTIILPRQAPDKRWEISFKKRSFSRCSHYDFLSRRSVRRSESLEPPGKKTGFLRHLYIKVIFLPRQARDKHRENSKKARFVAEVRGGRMARESQESDPLPVLGQASIALVAAGPACTPLVVLAVTMTPAIIRPLPSSDRVISLMTGCLVSISGRRMEWCMAVRRRCLVTSHTHTRILNSSYHALLVMNNDS